MPSRKSVVRHDASEVQGSGAWVEVVAVKVDEIRKLRARSQESAKAREAYELAVEERKAGKDVELPDVPDFDEFEEGMNTLKSHIRSWNFVDDDGKPLPQPRENPDVVYELTSDEAKFITELLIGEEESKN